MLIDYNSLVIATGCSGTALGVTMFVSWLTARHEKFLLVWTLAAMLLVAGTLLYCGYNLYFQRWLGLLAFTVLLLGFTCAFAGAHSFTYPKRGLSLAVGIGAAAQLPVIVPFVLGLDGLGVVGANVSIAALLFATGWTHWQGRSEAPLPIAGLLALYSIVSASFLSCGVMAMIQAPLVLQHPPRNLAEDINIVIVILGITAIGALSVAINQTRLARLHKTEARTDPLTGLLNRRALLEAYGTRGLDVDTAVVVFDLDCFKLVNDSFGHDMGDAVLRRFTAVMQENLRARDSAARLGGEEFALVLHRVTRDQAVDVADQVRRSFAEQVFETGGERLRCTVSGGVAFVAGEGEGLGTLLTSADQSLYASKRSGRNRVSAPKLRLVA